MIKSHQDNDVCRTSPATPGLSDITCFLRPQIISLRYREAITIIRRLSFGHCFRNSIDETLNLQGVVGVWSNSLYHRPKVSSLHQIF